MKRITGTEGMRAAKEREMKSETMFKLPENLVKLTDTYRPSLDEYLAGKISPDRFRGIRVPFGFYSERESNVLLSRVRVPGGCATADQLRALAHAAKKFHASIHITDRQDIQLHDITYEDSFKLLEYLKDYELSSIGGGGNTVRNVTACPLSGICADEVFDCRKHAISVSEYLLSDPSAIGMLPRKYKVAFSGCAKDCAYAIVNDLGLIAREKDGKKGFRVYCGGGLGASSAIGQVLEEFIPEEQVGHVAKAVMKTYEKHGDKFNRHRNRMRFLVQQLGFERFKELYREALRQVRDNEKFVLRDVKFKEASRAKGPAALENLQTKDADFRTFLKNNILAQKSAGYFAVELNIAQGDILPERLEKLAALEELVPELEFMLTQRQNLLLCNIPGTTVADVYQRLKAIFEGAGFVIAHDLLKIVACKGATTCNLGLCHSPGLSRAIIAELASESIDADSLKEFAINISGCPNNCGQHAIGVIGLHGITRKVGQRPVPMYKVLVGGRTGEHATALGQEVGRIPAKVVPRFLKEYFLAAQDRVKNYPTVYDYLREEGTELLKKLAEKYSRIPTYEEAKEYYRDWERDDDFSLAGLGPSECGSGVLDLIEADLSDAEKSLTKARENGFPEDSLKNALIFSARALQVVKGLEPKTDDEVVASFLSAFVDKGITEKELGRVKDIHEQLKKGLKEGEKAGVYGFLEEFHRTIAALYKQMDSSFKFPAELKAAELKTERVLDLKGVKCPINYVKVKLYLEPLEKGTVVTLLLDEGEPIQNVPRSLENDGNEVLDTVKENGHYKVIVKKW